MKRLASTVAIVAAFSFAACGGGNGDSRATKAKDCPAGFSYDEKAQSCEAPADEPGTSAPTATAAPFTASPPTSIAITTGLAPERIIAGCTAAHAALATAQERPLVNADVLAVTIGFAPNIDAANSLGGLGPVLEGLAFANQSRWTSTLQVLDQWCTSKGV